MLDLLIKDFATAGLSCGIPSIGARELAALVTMDDAIACVDQAMRHLTIEGVSSPERWAMPVKDGARMGIMPGVSVSLGRFGIKVLSLFPASQRGDLPSHQGIMLLFDLANGRPLCTVDGNGLTGLRTAAASAVATRALSNPAASILTILGCGEQARPHILAMLRVRPISQIRLWNRTRERASRLAEQFVALPGVGISVFDTVAEAVDGADIVCTLTGADAPILHGDHIQPGQHLNVVGSSQKGPREVDAAVVARARYIADYREHALSQGAELIDAVKHGLVGFHHVAGDIGEVLEGRVAGRLSVDDVTLYKSLGHIVQDLAVADFAYRRWEAHSE